jgi:hypothetical protein
VVEFGILALLFAAMMFALVELGLLLNGWVSVSSTTREASRWAATGLRVRGSGGVEGIYDKVLKGQSPPGVPASDQTFIVRYAAGANIWACNQDWCVPPAMCAADPDCVPPAPCTDPQCIPATAFPIPGPPPIPPIGVDVTVTINAEHYQVITPLVRPWFGCAGQDPNCYLPIRSYNTMYYEGVR